MARKTILGAAIMALTCAGAANAQEIPVKDGDLWEVTAISVDDGHMAEYADFLAGPVRKECDFTASKGWTKKCIILSNVHPRKGEPDIFIVRIMDHLATPAEEEARGKELDAFMQSSQRQYLQESGVRAKYRHVDGMELLQELVFRH